MKLQCNVSDSFAETIDRAFQRAALEKTPDGKPPRLSNLIPTALIHYGRTALGLEIDPALRVEAEEVLARKPGPRTKKRVEAEPADEEAFLWVSNVALSTGCATVTGDGMSLSLCGCHVPKTAAAKAIEEGWGVILESRQGVPGLRFVPPS
jgi:hypothetical protein